MARARLRKPADEIFSIKRRFLAVQVLIP